MPRLRIAAIATAIAALGILPAAARAAVTSSQISAWTSSQSGTPANSPYLISFDNASTTIRVTGTATSDAAPPNQVDVVCFFGSPTQPPVALKSAVAVVGGTFDTGNVLLKTIAGHACRLRAVPTHGGTSDDTDAFAAARIAVSQAKLPVALSAPPNAGAPFNYYVNAVTFTSFAAWSAVGTPRWPINGVSQYACGSPSVAPIDAGFTVGNNFAIDCAGSLLSDDLGVWGGRAQVQVDGRNAYDPAAAASLFPNSATFPKTLAASVNFDPTSGLVSSTAHEPFVVCNGPNADPPTAITCPSFSDAGVRLERTVTTSGGGRAVTMTDTWSSSDGAAHSLDLLYDDVVGVAGFGDGNRGWQFAGQSGFAQYGAGAAVPAPASAPSSILVRTNVRAADGDPNEAFGAITFASAPAGFRFAGNGEMEEHRPLVVPAGGSASLTYIYSVGYTAADVTHLALTAQDRLQPLAVHVTSPADGATALAPPVTITGTATAGSGIASVVAAGQTVPVAPDGTWSANVALNPGSNTINILATDAAGASAQGQLTVLYQPPAPPPTPWVARCNVPWIKGMKLRAAKRALRQAHCKVGKIKHVKSRKLHPGRVMSTTPRAGRHLPAGSRVELSVVSKGR